MAGAEVEFASGVSEWFNREISASNSAIRRFSECARRANGSDFFRNRPMMGLKPRRGVQRRANTAARMTPTANTARATGQVNATPRDRKSVV